jgi:hypothetical protein
MNKQAHNGKKIHSLTVIRWKNFHQWKYWKTVEKKIWRRRGRYAYIMLRHTEVTVMGQADRGRRRRVLRKLKTANCEEMIFYKRKLHQKEFVYLSISQHIVKHDEVEEVSVRKCSLWHTHTHTHRENVHAN